MGVIRLDTCAAARVKVLTSLLQRGWIEPVDGGHVLTDAGYAAIGQQRPMPPDDVQPMDATDDSNFWRASRSAWHQARRAGDGCAAPPQGATSLN